MEGRNKIRYGEARQSQARHETPTLTPSSPRSVRGASQANKLGNCGRGEIFLTRHAFVICLKNSARTLSIVCVVQLA